MPAVRTVLVTALLLLAVVLQVSFFPWFGFDGVVPNLVLLLVVAAGLTLGAESAALLGLVGGFAIDLVPPADHLAGRWALALVLVGYLAGRARRETGRGSVLALATVAVCSFVGTSVFALGGMLLGDTAVPVSEALWVIAVSVGYDLLLTPFVLPPALKVFRLLAPRRLAVA